ncbi:hypothetical protein OG689_44055 [Kitasatospora sp. NBC_00240]|uniref:hypothetical protein n=1 Tax=Kitasatospora sp. NBC_00240 TaxID=2903567 RepID=UPI0022521FF5|nr:hypothetical protein [Kitasatospora sp. NBC_00240]MCX5216111.1 hypothetical protein [Kitasatospora sp. NBC_00240]
MTYKPDNDHLPEPGWLPNGHLLGMARLEDARGAEPGQHVRHAARLVEQANQLLAQAVVADRARGNSWDEIGAALGVTRSTAHGRYGTTYRRWAKHPVAGVDQVAEAVWELDQLWDGIQELAAEHGLQVNIPGAHQPSETSAVTFAGHTDREAEQHDVVVHRPDGKPIFMVQLKHQTNPSAALTDVWRAHHELAVPWPAPAVSPQDERLAALEARVRRIEDEMEHHGTQQAAAERCHRHTDG